MVSIYRLVDPETFKIRYIGQTTEPLHIRLRKHISTSRDREYHSACWIKSLKRRGLAPIIELLVEVETQDTADCLEALLIAYYRSIGYDLTNLQGGGKGKGRLHSEEIGRRISAAKKGKPNGLLGKKQTPEHKANSSLAKKGKKFSEEHKANLSSALTGRKLSPEHIEKMATSNRGKIIERETRDKISKKLMGHKVPEEVRKKISNTLLENCLYFGYWEQFQVLVA